MVGSGRPRPGAGGGLDDPRLAVQNDERGAAGGSHLVPLGEEALAWLEAYLGQARLRLVQSGETHVFLSKFGRPMQNEPLIRLVNGLGRRAGSQRR
jgi:site-specific recombinase XerD